MAKNPNKNAVTTLDQKAKTAVAKTGGSNDLMIGGDVAGGFKVKRLVTLPQIKLSHIPAKGYSFVAGKIVGEIYQGKGEGTVAGDGKKMAPPRLVQVVAYQRGEEKLPGVPAVIIAGAVLEKEIVENYPDKSYVGKAFAIGIYRNPDKRYNHYRVAEIDEPTAEEIAAYMKAQEGKTFQQPKDTSEQPGDAAD